MAKDFVKLSEVPVLETASDNATVLVEENGEIKRVPKNEVGGGGAIATAIIRDSNYSNIVEALKNYQNPESSSEKVTYECINMTFEEAYQAMENKEPLMVIGMLTTIGYSPTGGGVSCVVGEPTFSGITMSGVQCIVILFNSIIDDNENPLYLYWTQHGVHTFPPYNGG